MELCSVCLEFVLVILLFQNSIIGYFHLWKVQNTLQSLWKTEFTHHYETLNSFFIHHNNVEQLWWHIKVQCGVTPVKFHTFSINPPSLSYTSSLPACVSKSCVLLCQGPVDPYCFVEFYDHPSAAAALAAMNKRMCMGRVSNVYSVKCLWKACSLNVSYIWWNGRVKYCIQGKFRPCFIFTLFALSPEGEFKTGLIESYIEDYIRKLGSGANLNLRLGESVSELYRAKIRLGELKAVYSNLHMIWDNFTECVLQVWK